MQEVPPRDIKRLYLSVGNVKLLFGLYLVLLLAGVAFTIYSLQAFARAEDKEWLAVAAGAAMSLSGSAVFYIRKLYRACINDSYTFAPKGGLAPVDEVRRIGTIAYFLFRPVFGIAFSVVVYSLWRLSMTASGADNVDAEEGFLYITISLGFLSGFMAGRVLGMLEGYGAQRFGALMPKDP